MTQYALVINGTVANVGTWDGIATVPGGTFVELASGSTPPAIGSTYAGGVFTPPVPPAPAQGIVYQNSPVSGATVALPSAYSPGAGFRKLYVYLQPAAALAALSLDLDVTAPQDGDSVYVVSTKAITALTLVPAPGNGAATVALAAGVFFHLEYSAQLGAYYKVA